jgi:hypothetical protein
MEKCCVLFEVRTEFVIIWMNASFKGSLIIVNYKMYLIFKSVKSTLIFYDHLGII